LQISNMALSNDIDIIDLDAPLPPRIYDIDVLSRFFDEDDVAELAVNPATEHVEPKDIPKVLSQQESTKAIKTTGRSVNALSSTPPESMPLAVLEQASTTTFRCVVIAALCCVCVAGNFILVGVLTSLGESANVGIVHMVLLYAADILLVQTSLSIAAVSLASSGKVEDLGAQRELQVWHIA